MTKISTKIHITVFNGFWKSDITKILHSRKKAQCALIVFGSKIQPRHAYLIPCDYSFWEKNPPRVIIKYEIEFYKDIHHNKKYPCMILLRATADM